MRKGFTLIELLVTFSILALVVGIITTTLRAAGPTLTLRAAAQNLAADLRYTAELTTSTQSPHLLRLHATEPRYTIVRAGATEEILKEVTLDRALTITEITIPERTAIFNTLGATSTPGTIILRHRNGRTRTVDLRPSGYVRLQ